MENILTLVAGGVAVVSVLISPRVESDGAFFRGHDAELRPPGLLALTFSQVTTWIFARSLMNAAILGFHYGIWGTLAYAFYYFSFLTGGRIVDSLRFEHGCDSVQQFLRARFGPWGTACYNFVIAIRLVSEVFANLLVIGILFGAVNSQPYVLAVVGFSVVTLFYSMLGGLRASLRTDVFQMSTFVGVMLLLVALVFRHHNLQLADLMFKPFVVNQPGPTLMVVALLQVWSYPLHDPVMMDRGFLADRETTRRSFRHAAWISGVCIITFGCLGVLAGAHAAPGASMTDTLQQLLGSVPMMLFNAALVISAMSTLDSTLASSAKLIVVDMGLVKMSVGHGRTVMALVMLVGLLLVFWGTQDLFGAVAVSGTASLYLAPVVFFSIWGKRRNIPLWSYLLSFGLAVAASALYFTESSGYSHLLGGAHKYTKLLYLTATVLGIGCLGFWIGGLSPRRVPAGLAER